MADCDANELLKKTGETPKAKYKYKGFSVYWKKDRDKWCAEIHITQVPGAPPKRKYLYDETEAKVAKKAREYLNKHDKTLPSKELFGDFLNKWFVTCKGNLKASSYDRLDNTIRNHVQPRIGHIPICNLTAYDIQVLLLNDMENDEYAFSTIKKAYNVVNPCLRYAASRPVQAIPFNPCSEVFLPNPNNLPAREAIALEDDEIFRFSYECLTYNSTGTLMHPRGFFYLFLMQTGLRVGEALALRWRDINVDERYLSVNKNVAYIKDKRHGDKYRFIENPVPKTKKSRRVVPLNDKAMEMLQLAIKFDPLGDIDDDTLVFRTSTNNYITPSNLNVSIKVIGKRARVRGANLHTMRHTFASALIRQGVEVSVVSSLLGHSSVQVTYDIYNHVIEAQKIKAIGKLQNVGEGAEKVSSADKLRVLNLETTSQNRVPIEKPKTYDDPSYVKAAEKEFMSMEERAKADHKVNLYQPAAEKLKALENRSNVEAAKKEKTKADEKPYLVLLK